MGPGIVPGPFFCVQGRAAGLDAEVVGAPGGDGLFDLPGGEVVGEGALDEGGEFGVGGEAEGDELSLGELTGGGELGSGEKSGEAETLFEADDAVLGLEGAGAGAAGHEDEDDGHDDPPEMGPAVMRPVVDGGIDGEDEVEKKQGHDGEVERRVEAGVVLVGLQFGHGIPLRCGDDWQARRPPLYRSVQERGRGFV